jgi:hypothetical protein
MKTLITLCIFLLGGRMSPNAALTDRADQIFRIGPETLVASSPAIVAGHISHYQKKDVKMSQPGPDGFPLEWTVTAELELPSTLKGTPLTGPIPFSRSERAFMSPTPSPNPLWEKDYGELQPDGEVVLFFGEANSQNVLKAIPSSAGEQNFLALVKDIVSIQRVTDPKDRIQRWLSYLAASPSPEGYRVALRSLVHAGVKWPQFEPAVRKTLSQQNLPRGLQPFAFYFIAFTISQSAWDDDGAAALELLCTMFARQTDPKLQLQNLAAFALILDFSSRQPLQKSRQPLRERTNKCLHNWASLGFADPTLAEEYKRMRQQYAIP